MRKRYDGMTRGGQVCLFRMPGFLVLKEHGRKVRIAQVELTVQNEILVVHGP